MTQHVDMIDTYAAVAEANGITTLEACIELVKLAGYQVTAPTARGVTKPLRFRNDLLPRQCVAMRKWERKSLAFTFADGETVKAYAMRESASKAWFLGSATRAACDKYRYRKQDGATEVYDIDMVPVPEVVAVSGCNEVRAMPVAEFNQASAEYRAPMRTKERMRMFEAV